MNGNVILDSNVIIHFFRNDVTIIEKIIQIENIFVPAIVMGELYFGAQKSINPPKHIAQIKAFKPYISVLSIDEKTSQFYGRIKNQLKQMGKPIPENDIWIAAVTLQTGFPLMTNDKHFQHIPDISII